MVAKYSAFSVRIPLWASLMIWRATSSVIGSVRSSAFVAGPLPSRDNAVTHTDQAERKCPRSGWGDLLRATLPETALDVGQFMQRSKKIEFPQEPDEKQAQGPCTWFDTYPGRGAKINQALSGKIQSAGNLKKAPMATLVATICKIR